MCQKVFFQAEVNRNLVNKKAKSAVPDIKHQPIVNYNLMMNDSHYTPLTPSHLKNIESTYGNYYQMQ